MSIGKFSDVEWIIDAQDGKTSTIKFTNGTKITVPRKEAAKMAKMLNKEKKEREKRYGTTK